MISIGVLLDEWLARHGSDREAGKALITAFVVEAATGMTVLAGTDHVPGKVTDVATAMQVSGRATAAATAAEGQAVIAEASHCVGQKLLADDLTKAKPKLYRG
jgi:hypothetical protein